MQHFKEDSSIGVDLVAMNKILPSKTSMHPSSGVANWLPYPDAGPVTSADSSGTPPLNTVNAFIHCSVHYLFSLFLT